MVIIDTTVAQERPPSAYIFGAGYIYVYHSRLCFAIRGNEKEFSLRTGNETMSPESDAISGSARVRFVSHPIYRNYRGAVCHGMSALNGNPSILLTTFFILCISTFPSDSGRIY